MKNVIFLIGIFVVRSSFVSKFSWENSNIEIVYPHTSYY